MVKDMKFKEEVKGKQLFDILNQLLPETSERVLKRFNDKHLEDVVQDFYKQGFVVEIIINQKPD